MIVVVQFTVEGEPDEEGNLPSPPCARAYHSAVQVGTRMFVFGGYVLCLSVRIASEHPDK